MTGEPIHCNYIKVLWGHSFPTSFPYDQRGNAIQNVHVTYTESGELTK